MKAAVFVGSGRPLAIRDVPIPDPGPGQLRVKVAACGVCHTDLHYLDHGTPTFKPPPVILGHEVSGTVDAMGPGVDGFSAGDRVLLAAVSTCGCCVACRSGRENICDDGVMLGNHVDGGYAEYVAAAARDAFLLPDEVPLIEGAIIADAITTPYHAVARRSGLQPGDWALVLGCGGIGLNIVQVAAALGGRVLAVDIEARKLERAAALGAAATIDATGTDRLDKEVRQLTGGGAHVAFEAIGNQGTQAQALASLRTGGRLVLVGYSPEEMRLNAGRVMFRELEVVGSLGCRPVDYPRVIELVRQGRLRVAEMVTHRFPLDQIDAAFDALRSGEAVRAVVVT